MLVRALTIAAAAAAIACSCRSGRARDGLTTELADCSDASPPVPAYEPHAVVEVVVAPFAATMVARDRETGAVTRDLTGVLGSRGYADAGRYALDLAAVDAIGIALRRPLTGSEPDAMMAIDGATGEVLWERQVPDPGQGGRLIGATRPPGESPVVLVAGIISKQVTTGDGGAGWASTIHALDARTGEVRFGTLLAPSGEARLAGIASGVIVIASRCSWLSQFDCEGIVAGLDSASGRRLWSWPIPGKSRAVTLGFVDGEVVVAVDGRVEIVDASTGRRTGGFTMGANPWAIHPTKGALLMVVAGGLEARTREGKLSWRREGDVALLGVAEGRVVVATVHTEEVLDAGTGERLCYKNRAGLLHGAWSNAPPFDAAVDSICAWQTEPFEAVLRGRLTVNGRPRAASHVSVQGENVVTDAKGFFTAVIDAPGSVLVAPVWSELARDPRRPCVFGDPLIVQVQVSGQTYEVDLAATTRPKMCPHGCDMVDCG